MYLSNMQVFILLNENWINYICCVKISVMNVYGTLSIPKFNENLIYDVRFEYYYLCAINLSMCVGTIDFFVHACARARVQCMIGRTIKSNAFY